MTPLTSNDTMKAKWHHEGQMTPLRPNDTMKAKWHHEGQMTPLRPNDTIKNVILNGAGIFPHGAVSNHLKTFLPLVSPQ